MPAGPMHLTSLQQKIAAMAAEWGYGSDSINRRPYLWRGRTVLDIGMGGGPHCVPFLINGAAGYIGVDPLVGTSHVRDKRSDRIPGHPKFGPFPFSPRDFMTAFPNCQLYSSRMEDVPIGEIAGKPQCIILKGVTEHLDDLASVFRAAHSVAARHCLLWVSHANYYSWAGHHRVPQTLDQFDALKGTDPNGVIDWQHLDPAHPIQRQANLNRVRLNDFRAVIDRYFEIREWRVQITALERLTPEIRNRWKRYTLEELLGFMVYVCGVRRDEPLPLEPRPLHHPPADYLADADHSGEDIEPFRRSHLAFFQDKSHLRSKSYNGWAAGRIMAGLSPGDGITLRKFPRTLYCTVDSVIEDGKGLARVKLRDPGLVMDDVWDWEIACT